MFSYEESVKMNNLDSLLEVSVEENAESVSLDLISLTERLDFLDIQLLRKFYMVNKEYPFDTQPYCFPVLYLEMKVANQIKIGMEALRKRLDNLVNLGLLEKIRHSNPVNYGPLSGQEKFVRAVITRFLFVNGLMTLL